MAQAIRRVLCATAAAWGLDVPGLVVRGEKIGKEEGQQLANEGCITQPRDPYTSRPTA